MTQAALSGPRSVARTFLSALAGLACAMPVLAADDTAADSEFWLALSKEVFAGREVTEDARAITLEAPYRADDAALVPLTVRVASAVAAHAKALTLIIDKNPAPVVAMFAFGPAAGNGERVLSTRVRIDMYSNVRAVVETADGKLLMATKFVKAAGGCSAPALKDADTALAEAGRMQVKTFGAPAAPALREAQLMIRHPQYSGMQLNQATGLYIPAKFIRIIDVHAGDKRVFRMEGGISLSENPNIRFTYAPDAGDALDVVAEDTDGRTFSGRSGPNGS